MNYFLLFLQRIHFHFHFFFFGGGGVGGSGGLEEVNFF